MTTEPTVAMTTEPTAEFATETATGADKLIRDPRLERLLPPPHKDTSVDLEKQILEEGGPRDPIVVWKGWGVILDGYRRHAICTKHGLPFEVREIDLPDRDAAIVWMIRNQLARRNMDPQQAAVALGTMAATLRKNGCRTTLHTVAKQTGVSRTTVHRSEKYMVALNSLTHDVREAVEKARVGNQTIVQLSKLTRPEQRHICWLVAHGKFSNFKAALEGEYQDDEPKVVEDYDQIPVKAANADIPGQVTDDGEEVPDKLLPIFEARTQFARLARSVRELRQQVSDLASKPEGKFLAKSAYRTDRLFGAILDLLENNTPAYLSDDPANPWLPKILPLHDVG